MSHRKPPSRGVEEFRGEKGALLVWSLAPHVLMIRHEGYGEQRLVAPFGEAIRRALERQPCHLFHDTSELQNYQTGYRVDMTTLFREEKARMLSLQALVRSKIVAMGAAVANLALGGIVRLYSREKDFDAAVMRALIEDNASASSR